MASISSFDDINAVLAEYIPLSSQITGKQITLARMRPLMAALDNPHKRLKIVHVAGTSGKTSTAYFVAALLSAAGKKTGLTVSPHVDSVTERIQINMQPIEAQIFSNLLTEFVSIIESASIEPTYFELLVAFAYWYFAKQKVDYAVVETGMGGLHDGTNIADNSDKICVITDIGLDHMHILGSTVAEIATQKAGIIHNGNVVIMYEQDQVITQVVQNLCEKVGSKLMLQYELELRSFGKSSVDEMPIFQQRNWLLAKATYDFLKTRDNLINISMTNLLRSTQNVVVPGRMETAIIGHKKIIMDGAHNQQKMQSFVKSFAKKYPNTKVPILISLKTGKEFMAVLPILKPIAKTLIITEFTSSQDLPSVALDANKLASAAKQVGFEEVLVEKESLKAFDILLNVTTSSAIITGSFYLLAELRKNHIELSHV